MRAETPSGWRRTKLGEIARERRERADGVQPEVYSVTKYDGFVRSADYFDRQVFSRDVSRYRLVRRGDFAYATIHLDEGSLGLFEASDTGLISPMYTVFEVDTSQVDPTFLFAYLKQPLMIQKYGRLGDGTVHRRKSIRFAALAKMEIDLPPLEEQRPIAAVLDAVDEAIERTEAVIAATEELRRSLLEELLTRGVPGWHPEWKQVPGLGTVPACWDVVRLEHVAGVQTGRAVNRKSSGNGRIEVPYLSVANVKDGYLALDNVKTMRVVEDDLHRYGLRAGDVLFTEGGDADKLGRGTVWRGEIAPCLHQNHVFAVRPHEGTLLPDFLAAVASSRAGRRYFLGAAKQTTNLASINSTQLKNMPIPTPPITEQERIVEVLGAAADAQALHVAARKHLITAKAATADALLTGRARLTAGAEAAT